MNLRNVLIDQNEVYLNIDNPEPKTRAMQLFNAFSRNGAEGRARSKSLKDFLNQQADEGIADENLELELRKAFEEQENTLIDLRSSTKLRARLLAGYIAFRKNEAPVEVIEKNAEIAARRQLASFAIAAQGRAGSGGDFSAYKLKELEKLYAEIPAPASDASKELQPTSPNA